MDNPRYTASQEAPRKFRLYNHDRREVPLTFHIPPAYEKYIMPGSHACTASERFGTILLQEVIQPSYIIRLSHYFIRVGGKLTSKREEPSLRIRFMLKNDLTHKLKGFDWQTLKETQYHIVAMPFVKNESYFEAKDYLILDIHPSFSFMKQFVPRFGQLNTFLKQAEAGAFVRLFGQPFYAAPRALYLLKQLMEYFYGNYDESFNADQAVEELAKLSLSGSPAQPYSRFSFYDIERLYDAERYITQYMDEKDILERQRERIFMNKGRFREGFLQIFGELPHEHLNRKRMERARWLLRTSGAIKIKDISYQVGYPNPNNFTVAYKRFYGLPPAQDRR